VRRPLGSASSASLGTVITWSPSRGGEVPDDLRRVRERAILQRLTVRMTDRSTSTVTPGTSAAPCGGWPSDEGDGLKT
jgi:hypothetical protein